jgi:hypothetical protein
MKIMSIREKRLNTIMFKIALFTTVGIAFAGCSFGKNNKNTDLATATSTPTLSPELTPEPTPTESYYDYETERVKLILETLGNRGFTAKDFMVANLDDSELPEFVRWLWRANNGYPIDISRSSYYEEITEANMALNGLTNSILIEAASDYQLGKWTGDYRTFPMALFYDEGSASELAMQMDEAINTTLHGSEDKVKENSALILKEVGDHFDLMGYSDQNIDRVGLNYVTSNLNRLALLKYYKMGVCFVGNIDRDITYQYPEDICEGKKVSSSEMLEMIAESCDTENTTGLHSSSIAGGINEHKQFVADHPEIEPITLKLK